MKENISSHCQQTSSSPILVHGRLHTNPCRARSESIHLVAPWTVQHVWYTLQGTTVTYPILRKGKSWKLLIEECILGEDMLGPRRGLQLVKTVSHTVLVMILILNMSEHIGWTIIKEMSTRNPASNDTTNHIVVGEPQ